MNIHSDGICTNQRDRRRAENKDMQATNKQPDMADEFVLAQVLFQEKNVWFYHVPAGHVSTLAPRADSWDPEHPFLTGSLCVLQRGDDCFVQLFEPPRPDHEAGVLLAQCPVVITSELALDTYVQDCADSSRYFMLRVEDDATKRRAYLGIGFPERASAFNFKAGLQDYVKYRRRQMEAAASGATAAAAAADEDATPHDLSLPQGASIRVHLKKRGSNGSDPTASSGASIVTATDRPKGDGQPALFAPLLPPPPAAATAQAANDDDDDWGDFTSA